MGNYIKLKNFLDNFKSDPEYFKSISTLSSTNGSHPRILVAVDDIKMFSGDDFNLNCKDNPGSNDHSSVDGICYYLEDEIFNLVLVEFKHICAIFLSDSLDENLDPLNIHINKNNNLTKKNIKMKLKLKPLETIFCILPHLIKKFADSNEQDEINEQLICSQKTYIFVMDYPDNPTRNHIALRSDYFDLDKLSPYPFHKVFASTQEGFETYVTNIYQ